MRVLRVLGFPKDAVGSHVRWLLGYLGPHFSGFVVSQSPGRLDDRTGLDNSDWSPELHNQGPADTCIIMHTYRYMYVYMLLLGAS